MIRTAAKRGRKRRIAMTKILFICHGNICRSPMAEFIFRDLAEKNGVSDQFIVASAATSTEEIGNPVYAPARNELARHGLGCKGKYAVQVTRADYLAYDRLICMDGYNVRNLLRLLGGDPAGKVEKLLEKDVEDPWYTGNFEKVYAQIEEGCKALLQAYLHK